MTRTLSLVLTLLLLAAGVAPAQSVWRCGPDGRSYSDTPCADGRALLASDRRSDAERAEALAVSTREKQALDTLAAQRRQREADAVARGLGPTAIQRLPDEAAAAPPKPDARAARRTDHQVKRRKRAAAPPA